MSPVTNSCDWEQVLSDPQGAAVCERRYKIAKSAISRPLNPDREVLGAACVQTTEGNRLTSQKWTSQLYSLEGQWDTLQSPHSIGAQWSVSYRIVCMSKTIKYFNQNGGKNDMVHWINLKMVLIKTSVVLCTLILRRTDRLWLLEFTASTLLLYSLIRPLGWPRGVDYFPFPMGDLFPSWGLLQLEFLLNHQYNRSHI